MIIQPITWMGMPIESALKITSYTVKAGSVVNTNDVTLTINRYTDSSCAYDVEQFTKTFT